MKALKILAIIIVAIIAIVALTIVFLPSHAHMERSIVINSAPGPVFQELSSFENFNKWSPWAKIDPGTQYQFTGPGSGIGAGMSWESDHDQVGSGTQKIVEAEENKRVKYEMTFGGFEGKSYAEFILTPEGEGTKVTWTYDGEMKGFMKLFGIMMDSMLGPMYDEGLRSLKQLVESKSAPGATP